jgi:hypothetical protein
MLGSLILPSPAGEGLGVMASVKAEAVRYYGLLNLSQSKGYRRLTHPTESNKLSLTRY